ncbi:MAG: 3'-5' exonuclease domain-containing protein 2 [Bacteroidales bacterium]|nr:3'-5' exonuclease domain-containing protein 2 [Bacteroidales bacterium]
MQQHQISISKETLNSLPVAKFRGEIAVISSPDEIEEAIEELRKHPIVGFDTESRPSFKKGENHSVALLQISTDEKCFLFRMNLIGLGEQITKYLEDESITKIGLSLNDDFLNLRKINPDLNPGGFIDLQNYVKDFGIIDKSLTKIYGVLFGKRISKGQRLTNWEAQTLTRSQQDYAALDAQSCLDIYEYLRAGNFDPMQSPYLQKAE